MKPWVKLFRDERGSFAQLPLLTRAVAAELLKLTDDQGCIDLGRRGDDPAAAICFALGAEKNERRAIRRHIDLLIADGYLLHDEDQAKLVVRSFTRFQGDSTASPRRPQGASKASPRCLQGASKEIPLEANPPESLKTAPGDKDKEGDKKEKRNKIFTDSAESDTPKPSLKSQILELEQRYPDGLASEARDAVALSRRNGKIADSVWLRVLQKLEAHPPSASTEAMRRFCERYADGDKGEGYLVAIARNLAKGGPKSTRPGSRYAMAPVSEHFEYTTDEELDAVFGPEVGAAE